MDNLDDRQIRDDRLAEELACMEHLRKQSTFIHFVTRNDPPDEYLVTFTCRGMIDSERTADEHVAKIYLHVDYPRLPPKVTFLTPSFHPNIAAITQMGFFQRRIQEMLDRAPSAAARQKIQQEIQADEDLHTGRVCLDALDLNWAPSITLDRICVELAEMIQYKRCNPADPLNRDAAIWAVLNPHRLPVDSRTILDLAELSAIRFLAQSATAADEMPIRILEEPKANA
jgi:ubiquitin-protein ligase